MEAVSILVVGSSVLDQVSRVARFPVAGESVRGSDVQLFPGGKGANQAVAVARLGARTMFCTCVGSDANGRSMLSSLRSEGIDCENVEFIETHPTGTALIALNAEGQNMIIACLGANLHFSPEYAYKVVHENLHHVLLLQAEVPLETVQAAAESSQGVVVFNPAPSITVPEAKLYFDMFGEKNVVINPAPTITVPEAIYPLVDYLTPNEHEAAHLVEFPVRTFEDARNASEILLARGCSNVVITLGSLGAYYQNRSESGHVSAPAVDVVDTVGAGDCFNGAFAFAIAHQTPLLRAVEFAVGCASISVTHLGAQSGLPKYDDLPKEMREILMVGC